MFVCMWVCAWWVLTHSTPCDYDPPLIWGISASELMDVARALDLWEREELQAEIRP